ncbi:rRNA 2'-O-methyltransferase fibrillarin 2 [Linum perenne]
MAPLQTSNNHGHSLWQSPADAEEAVLLHDDPRPADAGEVVFTWFFPTNRAAPSAPAPAPTGLSCQIPVEINTPSIPMDSNEKEDALRQIQARWRESSRRQRAAAPVSTRRKNRAAPPPNSSQQSSSHIQDQKPVYLLFECALGYALFYFHNIDQDLYDFESALKHIQDYKHIEHYQHISKLIAYYPFQSTAVALSQLTALYNSNPTKELVDFLVHNLPKPNTVGKFSISSSDGNLIHNLLFKRKIRVPAARAGMDTDNILRGLRTIICELILKKPAELEKFQRDVALSFSKQICKSTNKQMCKSTNKGKSMAANSSTKEIPWRLIPCGTKFDDQVVVVPHKFEGNKDGIETEYRIWNPIRSKLAAAIQCGVENIWVKPGSRVLYMGDICGTTVSHLSDLVGPDGLVYAVGESDVVVNMSEKRSNVIPIYADYFVSVTYRMFVSMVDVLCAVIDDNQEVCALVMNTLHYLRTGGHFLFSTKFKEINARPAKKVAQAKARKKRAEMRKLNKVKKKANAISDQTKISDCSKSKMIVKLYKNAALKRLKKEYMVAKKGVCC